MLTFFKAYTQKEAYSFLGALSIKGDKTYSYKLDFTDSNGIIKGYSITDVRGKDETKTAITGTVSSSRKELRFSETYLVYTKSAFSKDSFCYVHAKLKLGKRKGSHVLKGSFKGYKKDRKTECASGAITMIASEDLISKLMKIVDTLDTAKKALLKEKIQEATAEKKAEPVKAVIPDIIYLAPGNSYELPCSSNSIKLELWDHEKIDGDVISLKFNDKIILDHYSLVSQPKELNITLAEQEVNTITLAANAEGAEPPNTARLKVIADGKTYTIQASTTLSEEVKLILKKN